MEYHIGICMKCYNSYPVHGVFAIPFYMPRTQQHILALAFPRYQNHNTFQVLPLSLHIWHAKFFFLIQYLAEFLRE